MEAITVSDFDTFYQQANRFSEGTIDSGSGPQKQNLSPAPSRRSSTDDISQLESDIEQLQAAIQQQRAENRLLQAWQEYNNKNYTGQSDSPDVQHAYIESLRYELEYLHNVTGVKINSSSCNISRTGRLGHVKTEVIDGNCGEVEFQLKIQVTEVMREDCSIDSRVSHLSISTSENLYRDMKCTIERLANDGNVQGFMRLIQSYEYWQQARDDTFHSFTERYPKVISQADEQTIQIRHRKKKCMFVLKWSLEVSDWYKVTPDIQLAIQMPQTVSPPNNIVETAPSTFQVMLKVLGIKKSIDSLVQLHVK